MADNPLYEQLKQRIVALRKGKPVKPTELHTILTRFILDEVDEHDILLLMKGKNSKQIQDIVEFPQTLENKPVFEQAIKIYTLMSVAKDWDDLEKLHEQTKKKKHPIKKELTDFDKLLKAIAKVPKEGTKEKK
jgi:hypothetical protein